MRIVKGMRAVAVAKLGDHFSLLGLPQGMAISYQDLEKSFLEKQREFHPDRYHDLFERNVAVSMSSRLNEAYHVLKNPISRAEYLLQLSGASCIASSDLALQAFERRERFHSMSYSERCAFVDDLYEEQDKLMSDLERETSLNAIVDIVQRVRYNLAFLNEIHSSSDNNE